MAATPIAMDSATALESQLSAVSSVIEGAGANSFLNFDWVPIGIVLMVVGFTFNIIIWKLSHDRKRKHALIAFTKFVRLGNFSLFDFLVKPLIAKNYPTKVVLFKQRQGGNVLIAEDRAQLGTDKAGKWFLTLLEHNFLGAPIPSDVVFLDSKGKDILFLWTNGKVLIPMDIEDCKFEFINDYSTDNMYVQEAQSIARRYTMISQWEKYLPALWIILIFVSATGMFWMMVQGVLPVIQAGLTQHARVLAATEKIAEAMKQWQIIEVPVPSGG